MPYYIIKTSIPIGSICANKHIYVRFIVQNVSVCFKKYCSIVSDIRIIDWRLVWGQYSMCELSTLLFDTIKLLKFNYNE